MGAPGNNRSKPGGGAPRTLVLVAGAVLLAHGCTCPLPGQDRASLSDATSPLDGGASDADAGSPLLDSSPDDVDVDGGAPAPDASFATGALFAEIDTSVSEVAVYALGKAGDIQQFTSAGGASKLWSFHRVTGGPGSLSPQAPPIAVGSPVVAYVNAIDVEHELLYLTSTSGSLHVERLWGSNWSPSDISSAASDAGAQAAAAGSSLVGYVDSFAQTDNVFYVGSDQGVHVLVWSSGAGWSTSDVSAQAGASGNVNGSVLSGHIDRACKGNGLSQDGGNLSSQDGGEALSEEIFYVASDQHVHQLSRSLPNAWLHTDVSGVAAAPLAAIGSPLVTFSDPVAAADVVFYLGAETDAHIHELLFSCTSSTWRSVDLWTGTAPAPPTPTRTFAGLPRSVGVENLYYLGQDNEVYEFWAFSSTSPSWAFTAVSKGLAANAAVGSPLAVDEDVLGGHVRTEVYYVDVSDHVHELFSDPTMLGWNQLDVALAVDAGAPSSIP